LVSQSTNYDFDEIFFTILNLTNRPPLNNRFMRNIRSFERDSDKISKELDIRQELRERINLFSSITTYTISRLIIFFMQVIGIKNSLTFIMS
jgi:hypothetical protein